MRTRSMLTKDRTKLPADRMDVELPDTLTLKVTPRYAHIGIGSHHTTTQICATITAMNLPDDEDQRAPVDMIVVLDISGSMSGDKLSLCKTSLELLLRQLLPDDRFGLVTFSDDAVVEIPVQKATIQHKKSSLKTIQALGTKGLTNISAAIGLAAQEMQQIANPNEVRAVFFLTDGEANRGITNQAGLVELTKNCFCVNDPLTQNESVIAKVPRTASTAFRKKKGYVGPPITVHCFGYGSDHDSSILQGMSQATQGGTYYFVENDTNVLTAFGDALGGVLSVVAQSTVLHLSVPEESKALGVHIVDVYHDKAVKRDDGSYTVSVGDFYAEESRNILFQVKLASPVRNIGKKLISHVSVTLSYTDTLLKGPATQGPVLCKIGRPTGTEVSIEDQHLAVQWLRVFAANELETAEKQGSDGNLHLAMTTVQNALKEIRLAESVQSDALVQQLVSDLSAVESELSTKESYAKYGRHRMQNVGLMHKMQRCANSTPGQTEKAYRGPRKAAMSAMFSGNN